MKLKDKKALQELSIDKLSKQLSETDKERLNLLMQYKIRKVKNIHTITVKKREIARLKTFINMKRKILEQTNG